MKKTFILFLIVIVAIFSSACESENEYNQGVQNYYNLLTDFNADNLENCAPKMLWDFIEEEYGITIQDLRRELTDSAKDYVSDLESEYGNNVTIVSLIETVEDLDDESYEYEIDSLKDCGIDKKDIQDMKHVTYKIKIEGANDSEEKPKWDDIVKINGEWYLCDEISDLVFEAQYID